MRQAMQEARLDALVLRLPENVLLLSGFWPMVGATTLVFPLEGRSVCIVPDCYEKEASSSLWDVQTFYYRYGVVGAPNPTLAVQNRLADSSKRKPWKRIGYEANFEVVAPSWNAAESLVPTAQTRELLRAAFDSCELVDASLLLQAQRLRKTAYEIEKLRTASEISSIGLQSFEQMVEVGVSGVALAAAVERDVMVLGTGLHGAHRIRAFAQVAIGPEESSIGYRPNEVSTVRRIEMGDVALLELGVVVDGYWADRSRVRVAGSVTDEQAIIFDSVRRAQQAAIAAIRPGVSAAHVDAAARSVITESGYGEFFPHLTGHGLGFRYHEASPLLSPESVEHLEEGILTSVEPGIYRKPSGGFRVEDDVLVTKDGAEILSPYPITLS